MRGMHHVAVPPPWPDCRTMGPITTQPARVLSVTPLARRLVQLQVSLGPTRTLAVVVPDLVRGLEVAESACRTGTPVWVTAIASEGRWIPVLIRPIRGARS